MARKRSNRTESDRSSTASTEQDNSNDNNNNEGEQKTMSSALSQDQIAQLLAGSRTRGAGTEVIADFIKSGEAGMEVDLTTGPLAGKEPGAAYTTLQNAKKRTRTDESGSTVLAMPEAAKVRVIKRNLSEDKSQEDWHVFLINTDLVDIAA